MKQLMAGGGDSVLHGTTLVPLPDRSVNHKQGGNRLWTKLTDHRLAERNARFSHYGNCQTFIRNQAGEIAILRWKTPANFSPGVRHGTKHLRVSIILIAGLITFIACYEPIHWLTTTIRA